MFYWEGIKGLILRQAKIYPPRQAAAAAIHRQIVDCGCPNARATIHEVECSSARGLRQPRGLRQQNLKVALPQCTYIATFKFGCCNLRGRM